MLNTAGVAQIAQGLGHGGRDKRAFTPSLISTVCPLTSALQEEGRAGSSSSPAPTGDFLIWDGFFLSLANYLFFIFVCCLGGSSLGHWHMIQREMVSTRNV